MFVLPAARVGADPRVCPNNNESLREKFFKNLFQNLSKLLIYGFLSSHPSVVRVLSPTSYESGKSRAVLVVFK